MYILLCSECGYERSSDEDGKMFGENPIALDELICYDCITDMIAVGKIKVDTE